MVSCWFQVLIGCGWHNRNFWDRIGQTLDIVTRAGLRSHSPNWTCSVPFERDWPWIWVPLIIKIRQLLVSCLLSCVSSSHLWQWFYFIMLLWILCKYELLANIWIKWRNSTQNQSVVIKHCLLESCKMCGQPGEETEKMLVTLWIYSAPSFKN